MYLWEEKIGKQIHRVRALAPAPRIAFMAACGDGALYRTRDWFAAAPRAQGIPILEAGLRALWERAGNPVAKPSPITDAVLADLHSLYPDEDDASVPKGWGEMVSAVTLACEMANGDPHDSLADCLCYAYQAVMEMAVRVEAKRAMATGEALKAFEAQSPLCLAEAKYQADCLAALEAGLPLRSLLFPGLGYPRP